MGWFTPKVGTPAWYKASPGVQTYAIAKSSKMLGFKRRRRYTGVRPELKYIESLISGVPPAGGSIACLNQVAEGTDFNNRVGRKIGASYLQIDCYVTAPTTTGNTDAGTLFLVHDSQPNNATPAVGDVLDLTTIGPAQAFKNISKNADRFKIVRTFTLGPLSDVSAIEDSRKRFFYRIPRKLSDVRYVGSAAGVPQSGSWLLITASYVNSGSATTSLTVSISTRFAFRDA